MEFRQRFKGEGRKESDYVVMWLKRKGKGERSKGKGKKVVVRFEEGGDDPVFFGFWAARIHTL